VEKLIKGEGMWTVPTMDINKPDTLFRRVRIGMCIAIFKAVEGKDTNRNQFKYHREEGK
jgi:hypothetical protein